MVLTLTLPEDTEQKHMAQAARSGQSAEKLACELICRGVSHATSLDDLLAPVRRQIEESGISDRELDDLFESARDEVHRERQEGSM